jgi:CRISPR-associated protein Csx3
MAHYYRAEIGGESDGVTTVRVDFGEPATNQSIVPDAIEALAALRLPGGRGVRFDGRASLPVAMALAHQVAHLYGFVAWRDPKLEKYVVAISHDPAVRPGDLLE